MADLAVQSKQGYIDTKVAFEEITKDGTLEESDFNEGFFAKTIEEVDGDLRFRDGFEPAAADILEEIRTGRRNVCVTPKALELFSKESVKGKPGEYCLSKAEGSAPAAPLPPAPVVLSPVAPASPPESKPVVVKSLPPLFRDWLAPRGTVAPAVVVAPAPAPVATAPEAAPAPAVKSDGTPAPAPADKGVAKGVETAAKPDATPPKDKLSGAISIKKINADLRAGKSVIKLIDKGPEFLPKGIATFYIPGASPEKVFEIVRLAKNRGSNPGVGIMKGWTDSWVDDPEGDPNNVRINPETGEIEGGETLTHTPHMEITVPMAPPVLLQSTVHYHTIRNNGDGTYEAAWTETGLRHKSPRHDRLARNQGSWFLQAVVDDSGKVVGTRVVYTLWTDPAIEKFNADGGPTTKWKLAKEAFNKGASKDLPETFTNIAKAVGSPRNFQSCWEDPKQKGHCKKEE